MKTFWLPTCDLRWNAGVLEQKFRAMNAGPEYGRNEWREVPDVLPRLDELPSAISRPDVAAALATGEAPRVRLDGGREAAARADMATAVRVTFGSGGGGKAIEDRVAAIERRYVPLVRIDPTTGTARIVGVSRADGTGPYYQIERGSLSRMPDMIPDTPATPEEIDPDFREVGEPARGAFYEFTITSATAITARLRSVSPIQLEGRPGFWHEVLYDRKPEPLRDADRLTYETVAEIVRSHSSPTMGAPGSVHDGQQGFIVYETDGLPFIVSRLAELATLDDGRTAKDMLHEQGSEIDRLKKLADYQAEEITRLEDTARLGLSDDPAAGATLAALTKERDELRAAHDNARAALAASEREAAKLQTAIDAATAGNADIARDRDEWKERAVQAARERDNVGAKLAEVRRIAER